MKRSAMHLASRPNLGVTLNTPAALRGGDTHALPPHAPRPSYEVDAYPAAPSSWMRSKDGNRSYFVPVKEGQGLWLDFNSCWNHGHDVAVVISVQGINPITGLKAVGSKPQMEQYLMEGETYSPGTSEAARKRYHCGCPKHKVAFKDGRTCPKCGFSWTKQNYLCTTGTPNMQLWIDGFRGEDGIVRQYLFTADSTRGVAAQLIGEDRVFAVGIAFFLSKKKHPTRQTYPLPYMSTMPHAWSSSPMWTGALGMGSISTSDTGNFTTTNNNSGYAAKSGNNNTDLPTYTLSASTKITGKCSLMRDFYRGVTPSSLTTSLSNHMDQLRGSEGQAGADEVEVKRLEIAAGAKIEQKIHDDPNDLDYWQEEPAGIIYVNYCDEEACKMILETKQVGTKAADAFMADIKVGN